MESIIVTDDIFSHPPKDHPTMSSLDVLEHLSIFDLHGAIFIVIFSATLLNLMGLAVVLQCYDTAGHTT